MKTACGTFSFRLLEANRFLHLGQLSPEFLKIYGCRRGLPLRVPDRGDSQLLRQLCSLSEGAAQCHCDWGISRAARAVYPQRKKAIDVRTRTCQHYSKAPPRALYVTAGRVIVAV